MPNRILIIEDDEAIRSQTARLLREDGYEVDDAATADDGLVRFDLHRPDCVLLDVMLPDLDGFEACRRLRKASDVPIIMVTARSDSIDVVAGLEAGADDYLSKPYQPRELAARIRAMLRRAQGFAGSPLVVRLGGRVEVIPGEGVVRVDGTEVHLTRTEFRLLCALAAAPGRVLSREALLESVWDYHYIGETKLVDVHVSRLRAKIEQDPARPRHVVTVRGLGYKSVL